jgi:hypothetical protein
MLQVHFHTFDKQCYNLHYHNKPEINWLKETIEQLK